MTLQHFLKHQYRYMVIVIGLIMLLNLIIDVTTLGIERSRNGSGPGWTEAWATEGSSILVTALLLPFLFLALNRLELSFGNLSQRGIWLPVIFLCFSLLHVSGFVALRKLIWFVGGGEYDFGPVFMGLIYELRKDFLDFLLYVTAFYAYEFIITRLQGEASFPDEAEDQSRSSFRRQFLVKMLDREYLVKTEDIDWIQSASNYVLLNCGTRQYPMRSTLKKLVKELDPEQFKRVHRTAIVNLDRVTSIHDKGELAVELDNDQRVPLSKTYVPPLREALTR
jgi:hypothetical protein